MERRKRGGCVLFCFFLKKHMAMTVPALRSSKTARGSAARRLVQDKVKTSRWDSEQKHARSHKPLAEELLCVLVFVATFPFSLLALGP